MHVKGQIYVYQPIVLLQSKSKVCLLCYFLKQIYVHLAGRMYRNICNDQIIEKII